MTVALSTKVADSSQPVAPTQARWDRARLSDIADINPRRPTLERSSDAPTTFVPMTAVDERSGTITNPEVRAYGEVSRGYTYFAEGDVLFAKITPCMQNGKHAIARNLIDGVGFGTTEFHVIRPSPKVTAEWLHFFVRQRVILDAAVSHFTGAVGQQRVPADFLANLQIPLPPLPEQYRIVALLDRQMSLVERVRSAVIDQVELTRRVPQSLREQEIGRVSSAARVRFGDLISIEANLVDPRLPDYRDLPHINGENIESASGRLLPYRSAAEDGMKSGKFLFRAGSVLYSKIRPYLRKAVMVDFSGLCSADVYPLSVDDSRMVPKFLWLLLLSDEFTAYADSESRRARMPKLNREQLMAWRAPCPSLPEQHAVVARAAAFFRYAEITAQSLGQQRAAIGQLPAKLLRDVFGRTP